MKKRDGWLIQSDPESETITVKPLGCLLGACVVVVLYVVCFWQAVFWGGVFGLWKDAGSGAPSANAAERPA